MAVLVGKRECRILGWDGDLKLLDLGLDGVVDFHRREVGRGAGDVARDWMRDRDRARGSCAEKSVRVRALRWICLVGLGDAGIRLSCADVGSHRIRGIIVFCGALLVDGRMKG